jgi:hypothetical protein
VLLPGHFTLYPAGIPYRTRWLDAATVVIADVAPDALATLAKGGEEEDRPRLGPLVNRRDGFLLHLALALRDLVRAGHPEATAAGGGAPSAHPSPVAGEPGRHAEPTGRVSGRISPAPFHASLRPETLRSTPRVTPPFG